MPMISSHLPQGQSQAFSTFPKVPAHTLTHGHTRPPSSTQYLWAIKHRQGHLEFLAYICEQFAVGQKKPATPAGLIFESNIWKMIPSWLDAAPVERQLLMARTPAPPLTLASTRVSPLPVFSCLATAVSPCFSSACVFLTPQCQSLIFYCILLFLQWAILKITSQKLRMLSRSLSVY